MLSKLGSCLRAIILITMFAMFAPSLACTSMALGRRFPIDPRSGLKIGHDQKRDVLRKMGQPYRRFVDTEGREVFTYVWADGKGQGQKAIIAFNANDVVYLVEVAP
jgi:hypothetical protein